MENFGRTTGNALKILEHLLREPLIDVKGARELTGVSSQAANQLIGRFEESGILAEFTGQARNRRFRYAAYIELFGGDE